MNILNKMKNKTYYPVGTVLTSKREIVEISKINNHNIQKHDRSFAVLVAGTSVKGVIFIDQRQPTR